MFKLHQDKRGSFQELAHNDNVKFGQLSYLLINPGCIRGDHFHTRKVEWFCCIHGKALMNIKDCKTGQLRRFTLDSTIKEFQIINPYEIHTIRNLSRIDRCEVLIICSEVFHEDDPDTFVKEGK